MAASINRGNVEGAVVEAALSNKSNPMGCLNPLAKQIGEKVARKLFQARGNHSEAHLNEFELAVACAVAAESAIILTEGRHA